MLGWLTKKERLCIDCELTNFSCSQECEKSQCTQTRASLSPCGIAADVTSEPLTVNQPRKQQHNNKNEPLAFMGQNATLDERAGPTIGARWRERSAGNETGFFDNILSAISDDPWWRTQQSVSVLNHTHKHARSSKMSSIPTSCFQEESTVLSAPVASVWKKFRELKLDTVAPAYVTKTETTSGEPGHVGSVVKITYKNGGAWECRITEVSDRNHTIAYEVIGADPEISCTSCEGELVFAPVTDGDATFLKWTTLFSNDADAQVISDQKYKKLEFFAEFKKNVV